MRGRRGKFTIRGTFELQADGDLGGLEAGAELPDFRVQAEEAEVSLEFLEADARRPEGSLPLSAAVAFGEAECDTPFPPPPPPTPNSYPAWHHTACTSPGAAA